VARQARAEATRSRLLEATVEALVECGYSGTTTQEVCRRAGASRGTLQYHFARREDLLVAALHHLLSDRVASFLAEHQGCSGLSAEGFVRALWSQWQGPAVVAWLELAVAARTHPGLREPMRATMLDFDQRILAAFRILRPAGDLPAALEPAAPFFVFALLNGLAVGHSYESEGHSEPVIQMLITLVEGLQAQRESP
jgi:AcrR family transcriptional regulator